jgi:hypothetical protein
MREIIEDLAHERGAPPDFMPKEMAAFIDKFELRGAFTARERALLDAPYGALDIPDRSRLIAAGDALHTLLWALKVIDDFWFGVPSPDERGADFDAAYKLSDEEIAAAGLRSGAELSAAHDLGEILLWRLRLARAEQSGEITAPDRRARVARVVDNLQALGPGPGREVFGDDLALDGRRFSAFDENECNLAFWVILARNATLAWLLGVCESWEQAYFYAHEWQRRAGLDPPRLPEPEPPAMPHWQRPDERTVARRVVALVTLFLRAEVEAEARGGGAAELANSFSARMEQQPEMATALSPREAKLIAQPPGTWSRENYLAAAWRLEALGCLLWALGQVEEMPPYDTPFTPDLLGRLKRSAASSAAGPRFRAKAEIERARSRPAVELARADCAADARRQEAAAGSHLC